MKYIFLFAFCILTQLSFAQDSIVTSFILERYIQEYNPLIKERSSKYKMEGLLAGEYNHLIKHDSYFEKINKYKKVIFDRDHFDEKVAALKTKVDFESRKGKEHKKLKQLFEMLSNDNSSDVYTMLRKPSNRDFALELSKMDLLQEFYDLDRSRVRINKNIKTLEDDVKGIVGVLNSSEEYTTEKGLFLPIQPQRIITLFYKHIAFQTQVYQEGTWTPETSYFLSNLKKDKYYRQEFLENKKNLSINKEQKKFIKILDKYLDDDVKIEFNPDSF